MDAVILVVLYECMNIKYTEKLQIDGKVGWPFKSLRHLRSLKKGRHKNVYNLFSLQTQLSMFMLYKKSTFNFVSLICLFINTHFILLIIMAQ